MTTTTEVTIRDIRKDFDEIIGLVESVTGITREEILGRKRPDDIAQARMLTYWLMREMGHSLSSIGKMTNRDHGSVLNGCRRIKDWASVDNRLQVKVTRMRDRIANMDNDAMPERVCHCCGRPLSAIKQEGASNG
jgi:chromosomal replication initiation ATPase DnaA